MNFQPPAGTSTPVQIDLPGGKSTSPAPYGHLEALKITKNQKFEFRPLDRFIRKPLKILIFCKKSFFASWAVMTPKPLGASAGITKRNQFRGICSLLGRLGVLFGPRVGLRWRPDRNGLNGVFQSSHPPRDPPEAP